MPFLVRRLLRVLMECNPAKVQDTHRMLMLMVEAGQTEIDLFSIMLEKYQESMSFDAAKRVRGEFHVACVVVPLSRWFRDVYASSFGEQVSKSLSDGASCSNLLDEWFWPEGNSLRKLRSLLSVATGRRAPESASTDRINCRSYFQLRDEINQFASECREHLGMPEELTVNPADILDSSMDTNAEAPAALNHIAVTAEKLSIFAVLVFCVWKPAERPNQPPPTITLLESSSKVVSLGVDALRLQQLRSDSQRVANGVTMQAVCHVADSLVNSPRVLLTRMSWNEARGVAQLWHLRERDLANAVQLPVVLACKHVVAWHRGEWSPLDEAVSFYASMWDGPPKRHFHRVIADASFTVDTAAPTLKSSTVSTLTDHVNRIGETEQSFTTGPASPPRAAIDVTNTIWSSSSESDSSYDDPSDLSSVTQLHNGLIEFSIQPSKFTAPNDQIVVRMGSPFCRKHGVGTASILGRGGSGYVYRGILLPAGSTVAVKVVPVDDRSLASLKRNCQTTPLLVAPSTSPDAAFNEVRLVIDTLHHPNLVDVKGWALLEHEKVMCLAMEMAAGGTLRGLMVAYAPLPSETRMSVVRQLARALIYVHDNGVIHGDVKPDNVLMRLDGTVALSDFGCARQISALRSCFRGSPAYSSPESVIVGGSVAACSDVWSFGCCLVELWLNGLDHRPPDCLPWSHSGFGTPEALRLRLEEISIEAIALPAASRSTASSLTDVFSPENVATLPPDILQTAALCLLKDPASRPTMTDVAIQLML